MCRGRKVIQFYFCGKGFKGNLERERQRLQPFHFLLFCFGDYELPPQKMRCVVSTSVLINLLFSTLYCYLLVFSSLMSRIPLLVSRFHVKTRLFCSFYGGSQKKALHSIVKDAVQILSSNIQWEEPLHARLSLEEEALVFLAIPLIIDRIQNPELGLRFFESISRGKPDSRSYSAILRLLARSKRFRDIDSLVELMMKSRIQPAPDAFNFLIVAYSDADLADKAFEFFAFSKKLGFFPGVVSCNSLLNALVNCGKMGMAHDLYMEMLKRGDGSADNYSTCIMVKGLCKEGRVEQGRKLIRARWGSGCVPNPVFYNILINGYCRKGDSQRANELLEEMKMKGFLPTTLSYGPIINSLCLKGDFKTAEEHLSDMRNRGLAINVFIYNNIINGLCKQGDMNEAMKIFGRMQASDVLPDVVTYNALISGFCKVGKVTEAGELMRMMALQNLVPNNFTYTPLIHGNCKIGKVSIALDLFIEVLKKGLQPDLLTYGSLVHGLVVAGEVHDALAIRDKMMEQGIAPDANIYNNLISGACKKGMLVSAKQLLSEMLAQKILPDSFVYVTLIDGFVRNDDLNGAVSLFTFMVKKGIQPGLVGYNAIIKGFCKFGMMQDALLRFDKMAKEKLLPDEFTFTTLIDGYVKKNDMVTAEKFFKDMLRRKLTPNVVTYSVLINGFCQVQRLDRAEWLFKEMKFRCLVPNVITYGTLIHGCCMHGLVEKASLFFEEMLQENCTPNDIIYHYLINCLTNCSFSSETFSDKGSKGHNQGILLHFYQRIIMDGWDAMFAAYNAIIICLCNQKRLDLACQFRDKMSVKGWAPDPVTFSFILHGIWMVGRSSEWKSISCCGFGSEELFVALKYSMLVDQYLWGGVTSEVSYLLRSLCEECSKTHQCSN